MTVAYQSKDTTWKEVLEAYFKEFIVLCLPDLDKLIDWLIHLPKAFEIKYRKCFMSGRKITWRISVPSSVLEFKRGLEKGLLQQGQQEGGYALLLRQLQRKFRGVPMDYWQELEKADADTLLKWGERLLDDNSLEEIFHD